MVLGSGGDQQKQQERLYLLKTLMSMSSPQHLSPKSTWQPSEGDNTAPAVLKTTGIQKIDSLTQRQTASEQQRYKPQSPSPLLRLWNQHERLKTTSLNAGECTFCIFAT